MCFPRAQCRNHIIHGAMGEKSYSGMQPNGIFAKCAVVYGKLNILISPQKDWLENFLRVSIFSGGINYIVCLT